MTDLQRVIDELRFMVQGDVVEQGEALQRLVDEYAEACREANVRLRQCDELLKQGLRSEALHLAEAAPNLLDLVGALDFPERGELAEVLTLSLIPQPEPLRLDAATVLNEAYSQHEPAKALLEKHRFLALARSPLSERLTVLRSLADVDPGTLHWDTDVREMERARLREIAAACQAAAAEENAGTLRELLVETEAPVWREEIPEDLRKSLRQSAGRLTRADACRRLTDLEARLHQAHSALDLEEARRIRKDWEANLKTARLPMDDPLIESVAPLFAWIDDDDRSRAQEQAAQRAIAKLERGLDDDRLSAPELARLGREVEKLDRALPTSLEHRFRSRLAHLERMEMGRRRLTLGAAAAVILVIVGAVGSGVYLSHQGYKTQQVLTAVEGYIDNGQLDEARKLMTANADRGGSKEWFATERKLANAEKAENERRVELQALLKAAEEATESDEGTLKRARGLVRTAEEKVTIGKLESSWRQRVAANVAKREQEFRDGVALITASLGDLDALLARPGSHADPGIEKLLVESERSLATLRGVSSKVAPELGSQANLLAARLQASRKTLDDLVRQAAILDKLTDAVSAAPGKSAGLVTPERQVTVLKEFSVAFPNHPRTAAFKAVLEANTFAAAAAKSHHIAAWKSFWPADESQTAARLKECQAYLAAHPQSPDRQTVARYEECLKTFQRQFAGDGNGSVGTRGKLRSLFSNPLVSGSFVLRDQDGSAYYLKDARDFSGMDPVTFMHVVGANGETRKHTLRSAKLLRSKTEPPPQRELARAVLRELAETDSRTWDPFLLDTAQSLLKERTVDAFLRYLLLLRTLEWAGEGNAWLKEELAPVITKMGSDRIDLSAEWMDPQNAVANAERQKVKDLFPEADDLKEAWRRAADNQQKLSQELYRDPSPVGWLERLPDRSWHVRSRWQANRPHQLWIASPAAAQGIRSWQPFGSADSKGFTITLTDTESLIEGTPVFALAAEGDKTAGAQTSAGSKSPLPATRDSN